MEKFSGMTQRGGAAISWRATRALVQDDACIAREVSHWKILEFGGIKQVDQEDAHTGKDRGRGQPGSPCDCNHGMISFTQVAGLVGVGVQILDETEAG
jgi:hypothetical protein